MSRGAFYNEIDPFAAAWLRELIKAGHIAPGVVDERSIEDIKPRDLDGFSQCHFFAGIGVWSLALRRAGWPDDRPVWTGSCPCQPFSAAGQGVGFDDKRHLWPHFHWLIQECRPASVLGEQVASKDADPWIDLVQTDLEALGFAFGAVAFPSAGVGAPHIRDRTYWVAHADNGGWQRGRPSQTGDGRDAARFEPERLCDAGGLADNNQHGRGALPFAGVHDAEYHVEPRGGTGGLEHARHNHDAGQGKAASAWQSQAHGPANQPGGSGVSLGAGTGPTNGPWADADWLLCRDGKWRPVSPGTFPLVNGAPARVGRGGDPSLPDAPIDGSATSEARVMRLRGYGNAINAEAATVFIQSVMESVNAS